MEENNENLNNTEPEQIQERSTNTTINYSEIIEAFSAFLGTIATKKFVENSIEGIRIILDELEKKMDNIEKNLPKNSSVFGLANEGYAHVTGQSSQQESCESIKNAFEDLKKYLPSQENYENLKNDLDAINTSIINLVNNPEIIDFKEKITTLSENQSNNISPLLESISKYQQETFPQIADLLKNSDFSNKIDELQTLIKDKDEENYLDNIKDILLKTINENKDGINSLISENKKQIDDRFTSLTETLSQTLKTSDFQSGISQIQKGLLNKDDISSLINPMGKSVSDEIRQTKDALKEEIIRELSTNFEVISVSLAETKSDNSNLLDGVNTIKNSLLQSLKEYEENNKRLTEENNIFKNERDRLKEDISRIQAELDKANVDNKKLSEDINNLNGQIKTLEANFENSQTAVKDLNDQINNQKNNFAQQKIQYETEKQNIEGLMRQSQEQLDNIRAKLKVYEPLHDAIAECEVFSGVVARHELSQPGDVGLFACARALGKSMEFLDEIFMTARDYKKEHDEPLSAEEKRVYAELNNCYRDIWGISFDVFKNPGDQLVQEDFNTTPFDKSEAIYMKEPKFVPRYIKAVYVPILHNREGKIYKTALVNGGNNKD